MRSWSLHTREGQAGGWLSARRTCCCLCVTHLCGRRPRQRLLTSTGPLACPLTCYLMTAAFCSHTWTLKSETETDANFFSVPKIWGAHDGCMESRVPRVYKLSGRCGAHPSQPRQRNPTRWSSASCSWLPPWLPSLMVRRSIHCRYICAWFWCKDTSPHPLIVQYFFFFCHAAERQTCVALGSENRLLCCCCCCRMKKDEGRASSMVLHNSVIKEDESSPSLFWLNLGQFSLLTWSQVCRRSTGTTTHAATACKWSPGSSLQRACGASSSSLKGLTVQRRKLCELSNVQWRNGVGLNVTIYHNVNSADS